MDALHHLTNLVGQLNALKPESAPKLLVWFRSGGLESLKPGLIALPLSITPVVIRITPTDAIGILGVFSQRMAHPTAALREWISAGGLESLRPHLEHYLSTYGDLSCAERIYAPYVLKDELGTGNMGIVFELCMPTGGQCDRVLKTTTYTSGAQKESELQSRASDLGIGPYVYKYGICKTVDGDIAYIVSQRLSGGTMADKYPYEPTTIKQALDLYYALLTKAHITQNDLKPTNLMWEGDRLYLIDYGIAEIPFGIETWTQKDYAIHMTVMGTLLVNSCTGASYDYSVPPTWYKDEKTSRTSVLVSLVQAVTEWIMAKFPGLKPHIRTTGYSEDDIDRAVPGADQL